MVQVQNGNSCFLWLDTWIHQPLKLECLELFSFAKNKVISVSSFFSQQALSEFFQLPLSLEAFQQLQVLQSFRDHYPLNEQEDNWNPQ
jgi:hypothetical protein